MLKRECRKKHTTCGIESMRRATCGMPHATCRMSFSVFSLSQRMASQFLTNSRMFSPQIVAHRERGESVTDRHVPPGEVAEQGFGEQGDEDIEADLEEAESHDNEEQGRGRVLDFGGKRGGAAADNE